MSRLVTQDDVVALMQGYEKRLAALERGVNWPKTNPQEFAAAGAAADLTMQRNASTKALEVTAGAGGATPKTVKVIAPDGTSDFMLAANYVPPFSSSTYKYIGRDTGSAVHLDNTGAYARMRQSNGSDTGFSIHAGTTVQEVWAVHGIMVVRADSANDTFVRSRILETSQSNEIAVGYAQRLFWGDPSMPYLEGFSTIPMQGLLVVPANATRTVVIEARIGTGSSFGGYAYEGDDSHNNLMASRVG